MSKKKDITFSKSDWKGISEALGHHAATSEPDQYQRFLKLMLKWDTIGKWPIQIKLSGK